MTKARLAGGSIADSAEHRFLRALIEREGGDPKAWRRLMVCIGAHVRLVAHNRVFERVALHMEGPVFQPEHLPWAHGAWPELLPRWREGLRIASLHEAEIVAKFGHYAWNAAGVGPKTGSHPMYSEGVTRFPLAASLWTAPWGAADGAPSAERWRLLQAHAMANAIEHRSSLDVDDYERQTGNEEQAPVPIGFGPTGRALRDLSKKEFASFVAQFPTQLETDLYARDLNAIEPDLDLDCSGLAEIRREEAIEHLVNARNYLGHLIGLGRRRGKRSGVGSGGDTSGPPWNRRQSAWKTGNIDDLDVPGDDDEGDADGGDGDDPVTPGAPGGERGLIDVPTSVKRTPASGAHGGHEGDAPRRRLYLGNPAKVRRRLSVFNQQRLQIEMAAHPFAWDANQPTPVELQAIWAYGDEIMAAAQAPRVPNKARQLLIGALAARTMVALGQPIGRCAAIECVVLHCRADESIAACVERFLAIPAKVTRFVLVRESPADDAPIRVAGFAVPESAPPLKDLDENIAALGHPRTPILLLPDELGVGAAVLSCLRPEVLRRSRRFPLFGNRIRTLRLCVGSFLLACEERLGKGDDRRLTLRPLARCVPAALRARGADAAAIWQICADPLGKTEARAHYTQHRQRDLINRYRRAAADVAAALGRPCAEAPARFHEPDDDLVIGSRLVARDDVVRSLITKLQEELARTPRRRSELIRYHNHFVLHCWLLQGLTTGMRAVSSPIQLMQLRHHAWALTGARSHDPAYACLSDKESLDSHRARLGLVWPMLDQQISLLHPHTEALEQRLLLRRAVTSMPEDSRWLYGLDDEGRPQPFTPSWAEARLAELGFPLPANFNRGWLRTTLLQVGARPVAIDAFLGHADLGESPFGRYASFEYPALFEHLGPHLKSRWDAIGLRALRSRVTPDGWLEGQHAWPTHLATHAPAMALGKGAGAPSIDDAIWNLVQRKARPRDWRMAADLRTFLADHASPHARALSGRLDGDAGAQQLDERSAVSLETSIQELYGDGELQDIQAATWLRLIRIALLARAEITGHHAFLPRLACAPREQPSPFTEEAIRGGHLIPVWRDALHRWVMKYAAPQPKALAPGVRRRQAPHEVDPARWYRDRDPRTIDWAAALALSSVLHAGFTDRRKVERLIDSLRAPKRELSLTAGIATLQMDLPLDGLGNHQVHRCALDPLSELLFWRTPTPGVRIRLRELRIRIVRLLKDMGVPPHLRPGNWPVLLDASHTWWSARGCQIDTRAVRRDFTSVSILGPSWQRISGGTTLQAVDSSPRGHDALQQESAVARLLRTVEGGARQSRLEGDGTRDLSRAKANGEPTATERDLQACLLSLADAQPWTAALSKLPFSVDLEATPQVFADLLTTGPARARTWVLWMDWRRKHARQEAAEARARDPEGSAPRNILALTLLRPLREVLDEFEDANAQTLPLPELIACLRACVAESQTPHWLLDLANFIRVDLGRAELPSNADLFNDLRTTDDRADDMAVELFDVQPWLADLLDAANILDRRVAIERLQDLASRLEQDPKEAHGALYARWLVWALRRTARQVVPIDKRRTDDARQHRESIKGRELRQFALPEALKQLLLQFGDMTPDELTADDIVAALQDLLDELAPERPRQQIVRGLRSFVAYLKAELGREDLPDERDIFVDEAQLTPVAAHVVSYEELDEAVRWIRLTTSLPIGAELREAIAWLMTLVFHLGLRPAEVLALRAQDVHLGPRGTIDVLVRRFAGNPLKSSNARRRIPAHALLPVAARARLRGLVALRLAQGMEAPLIDLDAAQLASTASRRTRRGQAVHLAGQALKAATGSHVISLYTLRHSFATWTHLALRAPDHPLVLKVFEHLPRTSARLRDGRRMRRWLLGSAASPFRGSAHAVAKLMGHSSPAVTYQHYLHGDDLIRLDVVMREAATMDRALLIAASGMSRSAGHALIAQGLSDEAAQRVPFARLLESARQRCGLVQVDATRQGADADALESEQAIPARSAEGTVERDLGDGASAEAASKPRRRAAPQLPPPLAGAKLPTQSGGPITLELAPVIYEAAARGESPEHIGASVGVDAAVVRRFLKVSSELAVRHRLPMLKPSALADPLPDLRKRLADERYRKVVMDLENGVSGMPVDGATVGLSLHLSHFYRRDGDVKFTARQQDLARRYLDFLHRAGFRDEQLMFVVRRTDGQPTAPAWASTLVAARPGAIWRCIRPQAEAFAQSYAGWLGVEIASGGTRGATAGVLSAVVVMLAARLALAAVVQDPREVTSMIT